MSQFQSLNFPHAARLNVMCLGCGASLSSTHTIAMNERGLAL